jgi:hypothetical protein
MKATVQIMYILPFDFSLISIQFLNILPHLARVPWNNLHENQEISSFEKHLVRSKRDAQ